MPDDNNGRASSHEFVERRFQPAMGLARAVLWAAGCVDPKGHAGEVVNEACVKTIQSWDTLRSPEDAFNTVVANTARTHATKCRRESPQEISEHSRPHLAVGAYDPTEIYDEAILLEELLALMDEQDQEIFRLLFHGFSSDEVGALLQLPGNSVRTRRSRAMQKLQRILTPGADAQTPVVAASDGAYSDD